MPSLSRLLGAAAVLVAGGGLLAGCGGSAAGALSGKSATQILSTSLAAAVAQRGVHYELQASTSTQHQTIEGDAGPNEGIQEVTNGSDEVEVELVDGTAYLQGNAGGLEAEVDLSASMASAYAGRWIAVSSADTLFEPIAAAVTEHGIISQLTPTGKLHTASPGKVEGQEAIAVIGGLPGSVAQGVTGEAILYVSTKAPDVPVAFQGTASNSSEKVTDVGVFNRWGERLALTAPSGAVPYSALSS